MPKNELVLPGLQQDTRGDRRARGVPEEETQDIAGDSGEHGKKEKSGGRETENGNSPEFARRSPAATGDHVAVTVATEGDPGRRPGRERKMSENEKKDPWTSRCPRCRRTVPTPGYCHACYLDVKDETNSGGESPGVTTHVKCNLED